MATPISRDVINKETNTRFWSLTGYKIGKPLDPKIPADEEMAKVWMEIFQHVQQEAQTGTLVTTYDRPDIVQTLADAEVANNAAAAHLDAATQADPVTAQQHATAAANAAQTATAKVREAGSTVRPLKGGPAFLQRALRSAARKAPPPSAPAADQLAHAQLQSTLAQISQHPPSGKQPAPSEDLPPRDVLNEETNQRFWLRYNYKSGQRLDMTDPKDREMAALWMEISREVEQEAREGRLTRSRPAPASAPEVYPAYPPSGMPPQAFTQQEAAPAYMPQGLPPEYAQQQAPQDYGPPSALPYAPQGMPQDYGPQGMAQYAPQVPEYGPQGMQGMQYAPQDYGPPQGMPQAAPQGLPQEYAPSYPPQDFAQTAPAAPQVFAAQPPQGIQGLPQDLQQALQGFQMPQGAPSFPQPQGAPPQGPGVPQPPQGPPPQAPQDMPQAPRRTTALTRPSAPAEAGMSTTMKIALAALGFGGLATIVYAATRSSGRR